MLVEDILGDGSLKRIPVAGALAAIQVAAGWYVRDEYVVAKLTIKELAKFVATGKTKGADKMIVMRPSLQNDVKRAREIVAKLQGAPPQENLEGLLRSAERTAATLGAIAALAEFVLTGEDDFFFEAVGFLDEVPSVTGAKSTDKVESLQEVLNSAGIFAIES